MKRARFLAALALLGIPVATCDQTAVPVQVCTIIGQVSIEGVGVDGVTVTLGNGDSTVTSGGGHFRFEDVEGGTVTVTISGGYPTEATFDASSTTATLSCVGTVTINFSGSYIRTARILGTVTVDNTGLAGVTVVLAGTFNSVATTSEDGEYAFNGLRAGDYSVEIRGVDRDEIRFPRTDTTFSVGVDEFKVVSFNGVYLRTADIRGRVSVEGEGLEDVTVSVAGGEDGANLRMMTDSSGHYAFSRLRAGDYVVGISRYNADDYGFEVVSREVTVALRDTATVDFEGIQLRTSSITGLVSVAGMGLDRVRVALSGAVEAETRTMAGGQYAFAGLPAGDYTVAISRFDQDAYTFSTTSMDVVLARGEAKIVSFTGSPVGDLRRLDERSEARRSLEPSRD